MYAVVDIKKKKKKVAERDQKSSADTALYAVVNKKKKEKVLSNEVHKNDHDIHSYVESESTELYAVRQDKPQITYSVQQDQTFDKKTPSPLFNYFGNKNKSLTSAGIIFQICLVITIITVLFLVFAFVISAAISYTMISKLRSEITSAQCKASKDTSNNGLMISMQYAVEHLENVTYNIFIQLLANKKNINQIIMNISSIFSDLRSENIYLRDSINDNSSNLLELWNQLNETTYTKHNLLNEYINIIINSTLSGHKFSPAPSCRAIRTLKPSSLSGYYWVRSTNGSSVRVYCEMTKSCGNITGGLTRVALLNNKTRPLICTGDFVTVKNNTRCVRNTEEPGCSHMLFPLMNISYSRICGKVQGSWFGYPGGFTGSIRSVSTTINDNYVDGISLTYGNTANRTHIWTFIADRGADNQFCPRAKPSFVGNDYSCLMLDQSCVSANMCSHTFFRQLQQPVTENIELRLCRDNQRISPWPYEGIFLGNFTIYVW